MAIWAILAHQMVNIFIWNYMRVKEAQVIYGIKGGCPFNTTQTIQNPLMGSEFNHIMRIHPVIYLQIG